MYNFNCFLGIYGINPIKEQKKPTQPLNKYIYIYIYIYDTVYILCKLKHQLYQKDGMWDMLTHYI